MTKVIPDHAECVLCGKIRGLTKTGKKDRYARHHISYDKDITIMLCWCCHQLVHSRLRWPSPFEAKYGKDKGFYELCKRFLEVYNNALQKAKA